MFNRLIETALRNRLLVVGIAAFILVYGAVALQKLPIDVFPDLNRPTVTIMTEAEGFAPEEVESFITQPIEGSLSGIPGVESVRSSSGVGLSVINVEFSWGTDIYRNRQLVQEKLSLAQQKLPKGLLPTLGPVASIMGEIQLVGLNAKDNSISGMDLRTIADREIRPRLLSIPGVSQVTAIGGGVRQYQLQISAEKILKTQLSIDEVYHNLTEISLNTTGGFIDVEKTEAMIRVIGAVKDRDDLLNSVVGYHLGRPVLLRDIGDVVEAPKTMRGTASINLNPGVILSIQKQPGTDTIELSKKVDATLLELESRLPKNIVIAPHLFRQSEFINNSIDNVKSALQEGMLLVIVVLFMFLLNLRTTLITVTAIPLSFLISVLVFKWFGLTINTMTLGGFAVAIGELVDDAIVDVENILRRLRLNELSVERKSMLRVILDASSEVRNSIVISTFIVILVFIPLFSMGGLEGRLFAPLGISYIVSLFASMIVSLTVTPVLSSYLLTDEHLLQHGDGALVTLLKRTQTKVLEFSFTHYRRVLGAALLLFTLTLGLALTFGSDFLPKFNEGTLTINIIAQPGISLVESDAMGAKAEQIIMRTPEVKYVSRRTGRAESDEHAEGVHYSELDVDFRNAGRDRSEVIAEIRTNLAEIDGAYFNVGQPISHRLDHLMSGIRAQIAVKIFGEDLSVLRTKAAEVEKVIKDISGLTDLQVEQQALVPQIKIHLLRDDAARFGIVVGDIARLLETAMQGAVVGQVLERRGYTDIVMRFDAKSRADLELIKKIPVKTMPDGTKVTLEKVADVYESTGINVINREKAQRRIVVMANVQGRDINSAVTEIKKRVTAHVDLPDSYFVEYAGQFESQSRAHKNIFFLSIISMLGIFFVLYLHFRSVFICLQIMLNIPLALIGGIWAVKLSGGVLNVASLVAFVTLCGIATRNGIMMISHYLHLLRFENEAFTRDMVIRGSLERLVPVLMTTLTAILGLVPLLVTGHAPGKEILFPVAAVIVGGLISSTLLDLFITPVIFLKYGKRSAEEHIFNVNKKFFLEDFKK